MIPAIGDRSLRLQHLVKTVATSVTFQRLVGAESADEATGHIYEDLALDDDSEPLPRAIVRHQGPQTADRTGTTSFLGRGEMTVFIQYDDFTDEQLNGWYGLSGERTDRDRRRHMNNLYGQISAELRDVATTAGCLEFQRLEEFSCGEVDPVTENGRKLIELTWVIHREGLP
ncbi:hypothetical protein [Schlesneria sp.]|uniref:hypothetical protein n=1 Tax=Schlesneria sp. TaxID=2762018 RepID=UPI002F080E5C